MATVAELNIKAERLNERVQILENNHNGLNEKLIRLDAKMDNYNNDLKRMADTVLEVKNDVKTLVGEPGRKWNSTSMSVITTLIGAVLGFAINHLLN